MAMLTSIRKKRQLDLAVCLLCKAGERAVLAHGNRIKQQARK
jgi:hypothetical protein